MYSFISRECFKVRTVDKKSGVPHHFRAEQSILCETCNFKQQLCVTKLHIKSLTDLYTLTLRH